VLQRVIRGGVLVWLRSDGERPPVAEEGPQQDGDRLGIRVTVSIPADATAPHAPEGALEATRMDTQHHDASG
jgi:hypothetical protein